MVFPTVPAYLDPSSWPQQNHQHGSGGEMPQLPPPPPPSTGAAASSSVRPHSMAEQARLAKLPPPETALKCPRCSSTNTKFCYFNNYSLSQPRHFCKTCRRYWTKGGALRNVPVGGGCRRNKKGKGSTSKSPAAGEQGVAVSSTCSIADDAVGRIPPSLLPSQLPFIPSLSYSMSDLGLNYGGIQMAGCVSDMDFPIGGNENCLGSILSSANEPWRLQQPPYLGGLQTPSGIYPLEGERVETAAFVGAGLIPPVRPPASSEPADQSSSVKIEDENRHGLNPPRQFLGIQGNEPYLSGINAWTDLSSFVTSSSSAGRLL